MKVLVTSVFLSISTGTLAFDLKGLVEKAAKDEKVQQEAKELAKKGAEYFKEKKEGEAKKAESKDPAPTEKKID